MVLGQDKQKEIAFFNSYADTQGEYNVFSNKSNIKIVQGLIESGGLKPQAHIVDLGCGCGVFTKILYDFGFVTLGLDISKGPIKIARKNYPYMKFIVGDVESLPFESESLDGILLGCILHHLPDPSKCAREVFRVLKPKGNFIAFDPNRLNPFMWLYRDKNSPFHSAKGVTVNERPIVSSDIAKIFTQAGFKVSIDYLPGIHFRYIPSRYLRWALPIYNFLDDVMFRSKLLKPYSAFVITSGIKI